MVFLLSEKCITEIEKILNTSDLCFYDDWEPHYYGPFSEQLQDDIQKCINKDLLQESENCNGLTIMNYKLTKKVKKN